MKNLLNQIEQLHKHELSAAEAKGYSKLLNELVNKRIIQRSGTWLSVNGEKIGQLDINGSIVFDK